MIKLETDKMQKAIERSKAVRPHVRAISADERTYSVTGSKGDRYTVKFVVVNGLKLAECDCKAGQREQLCYHIAAAAAVNIALHSMRRQGTQSPAPVSPRASLIADITSTWSRRFPDESLVDNL